MATGCQADHPADQRGRYVTIYNESGEPLCPGTAAQMDDFLEQVFLVLGETPPDAPFVDYHWGESSQFGVTWHNEHGIDIESGSSVHEHELVHAAHISAWPGAPDFLQEGLAVMLADSAIHQVASRRPTGAELDEALVVEGNFDYDVAWLVVSQIVLEHGMGGLRDFWFALDPDTSMAEVRQTYTRMFGADFDDLTQPFEAEYLGEVRLVERRACRVRMCTGTVLEWGADQTVEGSVPTTCDDPDAVTPSSTLGVLFPWRDYVVEGPAPMRGPKTPEGVYIDQPPIQPCGTLLCEGFTVRDAGLADPPPEAWDRQDAYRLRVALVPDEFDPSDPPTFQVVPVGG